MSPVVDFITDSMSRDKMNLKIRSPRTEGHSPRVGLSSQFMLASIVFLSSTDMKNDSFHMIEAGNKLTVTTIR